MTDVEQIIKAINELTSIIAWLMVIGISVYTIANLTKK